MKKFGILIFAAAIVAGILVTSLFSFGRTAGTLFNISLAKKTKGSGRVATESRGVRDFKGVDVGGTFQVEIVAGKDFAVEIEADDNLIPLVRTDVRGGVLYIETDGRVSTENGLKARIFAPDIDSIDASGVARVNLSGVGNEEVRVDTSGASKIAVEGETGKLIVEVSGASSVDAEKLKARSAAVNASGASSVSVFAAEAIRSDASGASRIVYSGGPKSVQKSVSGAASVVSK